MLFSPRGPRRALLSALVLLGVLLLPRAGSAQSVRPSAGDVERLQRLYASSRGLRPSTPKLSQEAALRREAPSRLDVLVVGCDFADSLMWGRDLDDFPGWPPQRRDGYRIAGTDIYQFTAHDPVYFDVQMQKVADYFHTVSFGKFTMSWDVHGEIVNLPEAMGWYGDEDSSGVRVVRMADQVIAAIDDAVDFSQYDTLVLIHAGAGQETDILGDSPAQIFSNYLDRRDFEEAEEAGLLEAPELSSDEGPVEHVLILPESESQDPLPAAGLSGFFGTRGVYCFEFGLRLGMLNLADFTPSGAPDSQGIGDFGLMGYGLFTGLGIVPAAPCALNRWLMGWVDLVEVTGDAELRVGAMGEAGAAVSDTLLVKVPIDNREYWLVEYRLQDPNGDLFFTFADSNHNRVPDYYDADSDSLDGRPTSPFDPVTDTWESTLGAEWDWFMSENVARTKDGCMRAGGSGLYIWHVDERVIEQAILHDTNTINGDRDHKGVDVEEADGIQDLDSPAPSEYLLGWDRDAWRGEESSEFGPDTRPSTETADGLRTGIRFHSFSTVVQDSLPRFEGFCTGFVYRRAMRFELEFTALDGPAVESARRRLPEHPGRGDLRLADLGTAAGDPSPDGVLEIVQAGDDGRVYAFDGALEEWVDGDGDPETVGVLAIARGPDGAPVWNGPPAIVDLDGDGEQEIVLAAPEGLYAFRASSGEEWVDGDAHPDTYGLLWSTASDERGAFVGPGLILDTEELPADMPYARPAVVGFLQGEGLTHLVHLQLAPGGEQEKRFESLGAGESNGMPTLLDPGGGPWLALPWLDAGLPVFLLVDAKSPDRQSRWPLEGGMASASPVGVALEAGTGAVAWIDTLGTVRALQLREEEGGEPLELGLVRSTQGSQVALPAAAPVAGLAREGGAPVVPVAGATDLSLLDRGLHPRDGSPYRPAYAGETVLADPGRAAPLLVDVDGDGTAEALWHDPVGRLHAVSLGGTALGGWPVAGPAEPAGSPAVGDVDGDGLLELVAAGRFPALRGTVAPEDSVIVHPEGELRVYDLEAPAEAYAPWPQGRADAWNRGRQLQAPAPVAASGDILRSSTLVVQPNPARGERVRVRIQLAQDAWVESVLYNLEGQEVARAERGAGVAGSVYEVEIGIGHLVSGYYFCRVHAGGEAAIAPFTVVR